MSTSKALSTSATNRRFFVFGARGTQGRPVAHAIRAAGASVSTITRDASAISSLAAVGIHAVAAPLSEFSAILTVLETVDGAFWHVPTTGGEAHILKLLRRSASVPTVLSTSGILPSVDDGPFAAVAQLASAVQAEQLPVCVLRPTMFLEDIIDTCPIDEVRATGLLRYPLPVDVPICWISASALGQHAAERLLNSRISPGRTAVLGRPYTLKEIACRMSDRLRREVRVHHWPLREYAAHLAVHVGRPTADATAAVYDCITRNLEQLQRPTAGEREHALGDCVDSWLETIA